MSCPAGYMPDAAKYRTSPLVVSVVSGYVPEDERKQKGIFGPLPPGAREQRVPVPTREVECYECGRRSHIPAAALSAHCVHCRAHLNAANIVLKPASRRLTVRTLGDVTLPAGVDLSHLNVICRHMNIAGRAEGNIRCSGVLTMRGEGSAEGQVQAGRILISAGARAQLASASAASVEIEGHLVGRVHAADYVHLARGGVLEGDCLATRLKIDPGSRHIGTWIRTSA